MAELVLEKINNEMHNYYVYDQGVENYANRLVKLTKLVDGSSVRIFWMKN